MKDLFSLVSKALPPGVRVAGFRGNEAISTLYAIDVFLHVDHEADFEMGDAVGARATLEVIPGEYFVHGILAEVELLNEYARYGIFRALLVPEVWNLGLTLHSRIFTAESIPQIIEKVLRSSGLHSGEFRLDLHASYKTLDHVCQYKESNLAFIARWMEREGMYYFFEQSEDREILVITDDLASHKLSTHKPVRYVPQTGHDAFRGAAFDSFTCKQTRLPASVHLKDYDYTKPSLDVSGGAPVSITSVGEIKVYGENFLTPEEGKRLATVRAQELLAGEKVFQGDGRVYHLRPGYAFMLEEHPRPSMNTDYLVTAMVHHGNQTDANGDLKKMLQLDYDDVYRCQVTAIPRSTQFRAKRGTAVPRIHGVEEAVIDAEDGHPYAEIDAHGRYKVKVKFDESDLDGGKASMWVRMLQPHGGDIEGFHFPLRKGTEVHLLFMGGDPDRPVITGVAHNSHNPSAVTQANSTKNVMQTGGRNRFEMEDQEGSQYIWQSTPPCDTFLYMGATFQAHNFILSTKGLGKIFTHDNLDITVEGKMTTEVTKQVQETYHNTKTTDITLAVTESYHDTVTQTYDKKHTITVASQGREENITGLFDQKVHSGYEQKVDSGYKQEITGGYKKKVDGSYHLKIEPIFDVDVADLWHLHAGEVKWDVDGEVKWDIGGDVTIDCNKYEVTQRSEVILKTLGNFLHHKITASEELTLGVAAEAFIGAKAELFVGVKADIDVSAALEVTIGPHLELESIHLHKKDAKLEAMEARLDTVEAHLAHREAMIFMCAITIIM
jgi:type VI secretion system secreted protein VgrG